VIGGFTDRSGAIVTADAVAGDAGVVEAGAGPCAGCLVAVFAGQVGRDVVGGLSWSPHVVMARRASSQGLRVIEMRNGLEVVCDVAVAALLRRRYVVRGEAHRARAVMAGAALFRRSGKDALGVTSFAGDIQVRAGQGERGSVVIETIRNSRSGLCERRGRKREGHGHAEEDGPLHARRDFRNPMCSVAAPKVTHRRRPIPLGPNRIKMQRFNVLAWARYVYIVQ